MKFSLCIETVFNEVEIYDRIEKAKDCGVDAIEIWDPSIYDCKKIAQLTQKHNIPVAVCCIYDAWTNRMNMPYSEIVKSMKRTISLGKDLGCTMFIGLSGELECKVDTQKSILIENLKRLSEYCEREGITIVLEALNSLYDHKGYYLDSSYVGFEIMKSVNSPSIRLLYDCYHMQLMEGNLINTIKNNIDFIGHFHSAGAPGRHELNQGEINYPKVIESIVESGFDGFFGFEYWPTYDNYQSIQDVLAYVKSK